MVHYEEGLAHKKAASEEYLWKNGLFYSDLRHLPSSHGSSGLVSSANNNNNHHTNAAFTDTDCEVGLTSPEGQDNDPDRFVAVVGNRSKSGSTSSRRTSGSVATSRWQPFAFTWQGTLLSSTVLVVLVVVALMLGHRYVLAALVWTEHQNTWLVLALFVLMFTVVSFPFLWGYILINMACGYLYGLVAGLLVVIVTVLIGIVVSHFVLKRCLAACLTQRLAFNRTVAATLLVISGPHTFAMVAVTRLTPIPFGIQNAIFAISPIGTTKYLLASTVGLLPTQAINTYLGSTLRSMEDVLSDSNTASTGYIIFAVQVVISIGLMAYVVHKARQVLNRVMCETEMLDDNLCEEDDNGMSSRSSEETLSSSSGASAVTERLGATGELQL